MRDHERISQHHLVLLEEAELLLLLGKIDRVAAEDRHEQTVSRFCAQFGNLGAEVWRSGRGKHDLAGGAALRGDQGLEFVGGVAPRRIINRDDVPFLDALILQKLPEGTHNH